jgi:hypothetical protein
MCLYLKLPRTAQPCQHMIITISSLDLGWQLAWQCDFLHLTLHLSSAHQISASIVLGYWVTAQC